MSQKNRNILIVATVVLASALMTWSLLSLYQAGTEQDFSDIESEYSPEEEESFEPAPEAGANEAAPSAQQPPAATKSPQPPESAE